MLRILALLLAFTQAAQAESYLIFSSQTQCRARSQQMCQAMGCDGVHSIYWWDCSYSLNPGLVGPNAVTSGSYAMRTEDAGRFSLSTSNLVSNGPQGLTTQEQSSLVPAATANANTVFPWVLSVAAFKARFSPPQISVINASVDPQVAVPWAALATSVNMNDQTIIGMVNKMVADGLITATNAYNVLKLN